MPLAWTKKLFLDSVLDGEALEVIKQLIRTDGTSST